MVGEIGVNMCRIYGYFGTKKISPDTLKKVAMQQIYGGPDQQSIMHGEYWALGSNRLAIQGVTGGKQPFNHHQIYAVYNGEIYNHLALKDDLKKQGYLFNDDCDGSVIIPLYEMYGENFVSYLNGMFAIAIIDNRSNKKLLLVNDHASIKSIYTYFDHLTDTLYFSSELPSLFMFPINQQLRLEAINEYLIGRAVWHGNTFFENIYDMRPSSIITKELQRDPEIRIYRANCTEQYDDITDFAKTAEYFDSILNQEIQNIAKADAPICLVTSGGLDSSYLTVLAKPYLIDVQCFNIAYEGDWPADERAYAKELAHAHGIKYHQVIIQEHEFPDILEKTIHHLGQPNSAPHALSTYALFRAIHQNGFKVAITGEGADEFFGGYDRFQHAVLSPNEHWIDPYFDTMCATTVSMRNAAYSQDYHVFLLHQRSLLEHAQHKILKYEKELNSRLKSLLLFDQIERFPSYILRRVDHLAMANSVEVRVPFCQSKIISFAQTLPDTFLVDSNGVKKLLYQAAKNKLPSSIMTRQKQPFTLPIMAMLKKGHILFDLLCDTLHSIAFMGRGLFKKQQIDLMIEKQLNDPDNKTANFLWSIMILECWLGVVA